MANSSLHAAKDAKNDEFFTRIEDINEELNNYEDKFRDKVVFCNCDDPKWSNFWKYFHLNFEYLGLKKLITTHYESGEVQSYKIEYTGGNDEDFEEGIITPLEQNGDFRSDECIALLDEADIVVTNPPFSLFREYINILVEHKKHYSMNEVQLVNKALDIIHSENLTGYNLFDDRPDAEYEVAIQRVVGGKYEVYATDERASVPEGSRVEFENEEDAINDFLKRLRAAQCVKY